MKIDGRKRSRKESNAYSINCQTLKVSILLETRTGYVTATIDLADLHKLQGISKLYAWWDAKAGSYYARYNIYKDGKSTTGHLHRLITDCPPSMEPDHINFDTLNNTRENLRVVTHRENCQNRRKRKAG